MKKALLLVLCSGFMSQAFAKDSTWLMCIGDATLFEESAKLAVNVYEHRNGEGRATEFTMIYGGHVLTGTFNSSESDSGLAILKNAQKSFYRGTVATDYSENTLSLKGRLVLNGEGTALETKLNCETLGN